jgi:hypothetical protein
VNNIEYTVRIPEDKLNAFYNIFELIVLVTEQFNTQTTGTFSIDTYG